MTVRHPSAATVSVVTDDAVETLVQLGPGVTVSGAVEDQCLMCSVIAEGPNTIEAAQVMPGGTFKFDHLGPGDWSLGAVRIPYQMAKGTPEAFVSARPRLVQLQLDSAPVPNVALPRP